MQDLQGLAAADFEVKTKEVVNKLEIFIDPDWIDLCDLGSKNYLKEANYSSGQRELSYCPVAAEFTAIIDDIDGNFNPKNADGAYKTYLKVGRKIRFSTGFVKDDTDYTWQWFIGFVSEIRIDRSNNQITIRGFDYTQRLTETKLKSPDNYWGAIKDTVTVAGTADYSLAALGCNGAYIAYLDGTQIYAGDTWIYDEGTGDATKKFWFLPSQIPVANDLELLIYYYTAQAPENVVADILVTAGLYNDRAAALAAMDFDATGVIIDRVRFNTGVSALYAVQKICERVDYEFYFQYDGTPLFKPIATVGGSDFTFGKELISSFDYIENIDEVRNHIVIEGEEYSIYDKLYRILDGSEIMFDLDDVPDGATYGRMALTSISAGKVIIAGCDAEVTDQMFTSPAARNNVEAWKHASNVTLIDGGDIYTGSVTAQKLTIGPSPNLLKSKYTDFQSFEDGDAIGSTSNGTGVCDTSDFYIGDRCLRLAMTSGPYSLTYLGSTLIDYNIRLKPSTKYIVSFYLKGAATTNIRVIIKQDNAYNKGDVIKTTTTSWVRNEAIITTDANLTNSGILRIDVLDLDEAVWIDAIQVEEASAAASPEASPYAPSGTVEIHGGQIEAETITAGKILTGTITANEIAANAITVGQVDFDAQLFTSGTEKTNIEAWIMAGQVTRIDGGKIWTGTIVADAIAANAVTTVKINADAVTAIKIDVVGLDGASGRIVVGDATDADVVTGGINAHATTLITAGKIVISGATNLDGWSKAGDLTKIDGGEISALTILAGSIAADAITALKIDVVGLDGATGRIRVADATDADVVTGGINAHATTLITAGKIVISGATNLDGWSKAGDLTKIDGGEISALTILAGSIAADAITALKIDVVGLDGATGRIRVADATDADVVTGGINAHATTLITAGKIVISGGTNLSDWRMAGHLTFIDGGNIYTNSIVVAGLASAVTDRMFLDSTKKTNIEAWIMADHVTFIDGGKIYTNTIVADAIAANAITTVKINAQAVEAGKIKTGTITATQIAADAIETAKIKALAVDAGKIAAHTITADQIAVGTITATEIAADAIEAVKIKADAVTAVKIDVATLDAISANVGVLTAGEVHAGILIGRNGAVYANADEIQAGVYRAMEWLAWDGSFIGQLKAPWVAINYNDTLYELNYYDQGSGIFYLGFNTADAGGGEGTDDEPAHGDPVPA